MNIVADEGVEGSIVEQLRKEGHRVVWIAESDRQAEDESILVQANETGALVLTADKDFGELVFRQKKASAGVALLRLAGLSSGSKAETVARAFRLHGVSMQGAFSVISPGQLRVRQRDSDIEE
jgi:predicted nuclease of predicted toxin-antitoxin system